MWRNALAMGFLILCMMGQGFAADYPLKVSDNQRYIVDSSGQPFFWQADTSWNLFTGVTKEDVTKYLDDRQEKGYNVIMSCALFKSTNVYGDKAWTGAWGTTPNEAFWGHVDWVVQEVEKRGMVMGFLPSWGRVDNNFEGLTGHNAYDQATLQAPANVIAYGNFLGERYSSYKNFVWILGGDVTPKHIRAEDCRRLANAIEDGQGGHTRLMTYHNSDQGNWNDADHGIGSVYLSNEPWLDIYGHHNETTGQLILSDYELTPTKPIINLEPRYEELFVNRHDYDQRRDIIRSLFSGALGGLVYGADPVWNIGDDAWQFTAEHWEAHLDLPGAKQSTYIREMMEEWRWYESTPHVLDTQLTVGSTYVPALLANNKKYALVYFMNKSSTQTITINMDTLEPSSFNAQWFDATNGTYQNAGTFSNSGTQGFTTPGANSRGTYDWVLCLGEKPSSEPAEPVDIITARGENASHGEGAAQAFDGSLSTKWIDSQKVTWIQIDFAGELSKTVTSYKISSANDVPGRDPKDWELLGSNDGVNYTVVDSRNGEVFDTRFMTKTYVCTNPGNYKIYKLAISANTSDNNTQLSEIEFIEGTVPSNQEPVSNAGSDASITLPTDSVLLNGTASADSDGTIANYAWTQISGASAAVITGNNTSTCTVSGLIAGTYIFQLVVTDNDGASSIDTVQVVVSPSTTDTTPVLHLDASTLPLGTISQWNDISGSNNNAVAPAGKAPQVVVGDKGTPVIRFDGVDDYFTFTKINTIRTVFMVLKEDADADKGEYAAFLLGDSGAFHFHRGYKNIFAPSWSSSHIRNGVLKVNGVTVDGTTTAMPEEYSVISIVTTGNVSADSLVFDRSFAGKRHWDGDVAEVIIYDVPLNSSQVASVENTLTAKWLSASSNNAPGVDAGSGASITLPNNTVALNGTSVDDGLPSNTLTRTWSKVSGPGTVSFSSASSDDTNATFTAAGTYVLRLSVSDGVLSSSDDVTVVVEDAVVVGNGEIRADYWYGISGHNISSFTSLASFPNSPDASVTLDSFELPLKHADSYGARVTGLLRPHVSGAYTFWIAADDTSSLLLSTDENESNKVEIAKTSWWTPSRAWDTRAEQKSVVINLEAGKSYFIEGLMKEGAGGDNLSVAWEGPGISRAVISGAYFSEQAPVTPGEIRVDYWSGIAGDNVAALTDLATFPNSPDASETLDTFELPINQANNFGARVTGLLKPHVSGAYTFWIAADNNSRLFLSTDASESNKVLIAKTTLWTNSRAWDTRAEQKSVAINLEAGKSYFIEGLVKEGGGGDNLSVAWQGPGFTRTIIGSENFSDEPISEPADEDPIVDNGDGSDEGMGNENDGQATETLVGEEFVLGINLGGDPVTIDGEIWFGNTEARILGMSYTAAYSARTNVAPAPETDSDTDAMLNSTLWDLGDNWGIEIPIENGTYQVYFWVMENSGSYYRTFDVTIEGDLPVSDVGNLAKGEWVKYGPFDAVVSDGLLNIDLDVEHGDGHIMGVAIYK